MLAAPICFIKGWWASKNHQIKFAFVVAKLEKKTVLASSIDGMLSKLDKQITKEVNHQTLSRQDVSVFHSPSKFLLHGKTYQIF